MHMAEELKTYRIVRGRRQWSVTLPRVLAQAVGLKPGDRVVWVVDRGELVLRKAD